MECCQCNHRNRTSARGDDDHSDYGAYQFPIHSAFKIESGTEKKYPNWSLMRSCFFAIWSRRVQIASPFKSIGHAFWIRPGADEIPKDIGQDEEFAFLPVADLRAILLFQPKAKSILRTDGVLFST